MLCLQNCYVVVGRTCLMFETICPSMMLTMGSQRKTHEAKHCDGHLSLCLLCTVQKVQQLFALVAVEQLVAGPQYPPVMTATTKLACEEKVLRLNIFSHGRRSKSTLNRATQRFGC